MIELQIAFAPEYAHKQVHVKLHDAQMIFELSNIPIGHSSVSMSSILLIVVILPVPQTPSTGIFVLLIWHATGVQPFAPIQDHPHFQPGFGN